MVIERYLKAVKLKPMSLRKLKRCDAELVFASNTSTLPITGFSFLRPKTLLVCFSPVDKMPLVEIICGEKTNDETLAKAFDYVLQSETPIWLMTAWLLHFSRVWYFLYGRCQYVVKF